MMVMPLYIERTKPVRGMHGGYMATCLNCGRRQRLGQERKDGVFQWRLSCKCGAFVWIGTDRDICAAIQKQAEHA